MPTYKTNALVLRRTNLGEADRIITFYTLEHGLLRGVARGVRKIQSRLAGHLEPFSAVELMLARGRSLDVVTSARLAEHFPRLGGDFDALAAAYLLAEMLEKTGTEGEPQPAAYHLALESWRGLDAGTPPGLTELYFKLRLLDALGWRPQLDACAVCGRRDPRERYYLSPSAGGIVCTRCRVAEGAPMETAGIKLWRLILHNPLAQVARVTGATEAAAASLDACDTLYSESVGRVFRVKLQEL